jgi:hypothetical protein
MTMCHVHTNEELANILETLADLFSWKRRERLTEAAAVLRSPTRQWRHPETPNVPYENGFIHPDYLSASKDGFTA